MLLDHTGNYIKYELQLALNQSHSVPRYPYLYDYNVNWNSHTRWISRFHVIRDRNGNCNIGSKLNIIANSEHTYFSRVMTSTFKSLQTKVFYNSLLPLLMNLSLVFNRTVRNSGKEDRKVLSHQFFFPLKPPLKLKNFELRLKITDNIYQGELSYSLLTDICFTYRFWRLHEFVFLF